MKTKIVATIGPASESTEQIKQLVLAGASILRLNMSHGNLDWHEETIKKIKQVEIELKKTLFPNLKIEIMLDTKGPEIRTGVLIQPLIIKNGEKIILHNNEFLKIDTNLKTLFIDYPNLSQVLNIGRIIAIDSGKILLKVEDIKNNLITTIAQNDGVISSKRHVNLPNTRVDLPILSESDEVIIKMGFKYGIDKIAVSFVRDDIDLRTIKDFIQKNKQNNEKVNIVAKIEHVLALQNIDEILHLSDQIMVARGDLGIETPWYKLAVTEQKLIHKAQTMNKEVIVATQMLFSMMDHAIPTRAEVMDVSIAVQLGAKAVMLSDETASGIFPVQAVETMKKIAEYAEHFPLY